MPKYDALLVVSFGGPEGPDEVMPFLENVLRGRNVPRERMLEVAEHYQQFDGVSPINEQNRQLIAALDLRLKELSIDLPIYWGNRNWHPLLTSTIQAMADDGIGRGLGFVTSAFSSYSGCRQYREDVERARQNATGNVPEIDKIRVFYNHPGFIATMADRVDEALSKLPGATTDNVKLLFTAHSIPMNMSDNCRYVAQLEESCRLVSQASNIGQWRLVYQSRSGPPSQPWLEPDICDCLRKLHSKDDSAKVIIVPIGFISDHMEVLFDLDTEALDLCKDLGIDCVRAGTAGTHPEFIQMICDLIIERMSDADERKALGQHGPSHDVCPVDCCLMPSMSRPKS